MTESTTVTLTGDETAVVGYGSLLSVESIGRTLGREYTGPYVRARLEGWRRAWDVGMPNRAFYFLENGERVYPAKILYLNLRHDAEAAVNCGIFVLRPDELSRMDHREWIYDRTAVTHALRGVSVIGGEAVAYVARPEFVVYQVDNPRQAAVRASYLNLLENALRATDPLFRAEYERTTDAAPETLVIDDVLDPDRPNPWAEAGYRYTP